MSGGVDSSVTAALLKDLDYDVIGVSMQIWPGNNNNDNNVKSKNINSCFGPDEEKDLSEAERIADLLNIPFHIIDLKNEYKELVLSYFSSEYLNGRTPNPCIICNAKMKFDLLLKKSRDMEIDFDYFSTGHYVRSEYDGQLKRFILKKAFDLVKDQSYFLYRLKQEQLEKCLFPLGKYLKSEIKNIALEKNFGLETKKESQDFYSGDYSELLDSKKSPGKIVLTNGKVLGQHQGIFNYTIGQRKGLGISYGEPLYVIEIDKCQNKIVVGTESDLFRKELIAENLNWVSIASLQNELDVKAKIRYQHKETPARLIPQNDGDAKVVFQIPQKAVTPGQSIVFYQDDVMLGGGIIRSAS